MEVLQVLADNLKRLRKTQKLSRDKLAREAGLSVSEIKNIEEVSEYLPPTKNLDAIALALNVKIQDLFVRAREMSSVRFRSFKKISDSIRQNVLINVSLWLDDFNFLEQCLDNKKPFVFSDLGSCPLNDCVQAAQFCRYKLDLKPNEPITDICGLLEESGIKIYPISEPTNSFFGLSVGEADGGPAIVVNVCDKISVERRIFSAIHELGHLILHSNSYIVFDDKETKKEEKEADTFASHFLMPDNIFRKKWDEASGLFFIDRVFKVKSFFQVSYKTVLKRLEDNEVVDKSIWRKFNIYYQNQFNKKLSFKEEPYAIVSTEPFGVPLFSFFENRFKRLAWEAFEKDIISLGRAAEILRVGLIEFRNLLQNRKIPR
jgi:Zn-dependent peptidase ImmA (M78 family)/transcriptional regulator with XRE-family HTH domain